MYREGAKKKCSEVHVSDENKQFCGGQLTAPASIHTLTFIGAGQLRA